MEKQEGGKRRSWLGLYTMVIEESECPTCRAAKGSECVLLDGETPRQYPHWARVIRAFPDTCLTMSEHRSIEIGTRNP